MVAKGPDMIKIRESTVGSSYPDGGEILVAVQPQHQFQKRQFLTAIVPDTSHDQCVVPLATPSQ